MAQELKVMTYNIRYNNPGDGENAWPNRRAFLLSQIFYTAPDIFGTQEGLLEQVDFIQKNMPAYSYVGVGRDDGAKKGEFCALFYSKEKFDLLKSGTFWLSPTPDKPSKGWDAALNRVCTYALLKGKRKGFKDKVLVLNTHFDHRGLEARKESIKVIKAQIKQLNPKGYPVVIMGDFNLGPESEPIIAMKKDFKDTYDIAALPALGPLGTFNGFDHGRIPNRRIDYLFVSGDFLVNQVAVLSDAVDKKYPSDHFPVVAKLYLK